MRTFLLLVLVCFTKTIWAQEEVDKSTIYQYKKYEKFDLGSLELEGELLAPGDVSVHERDRAKIKMDLFDRKSMKDFKTKDAESLK